MQLHTDQISVYNISVKYPTFSDREADDDYTYTNLYYCPCIVWLLCFGMFLGTCPVF